MKRIKNPQSRSGLGL